MEVGFAWLEMGLFGRGGFIFADSVSCVCVGFIIHIVVFLNMEDYWVPKYCSSSISRWIPPLSLPTYLLHHYVCNDILEQSHSST